MAMLLGTCKLELCCDNFLYKESSVPIRIHMFLGLPDPDPDPLVIGMDPDPSIMKQK
jgi:hypothetical protein